MGRDLPMLEARVAAPGRGAGWIFEGFNYFKANPFAWIGAYLVLILLFILVSLLSTLTVILFPLLFLAIYIFYPVVIAGFMLGCDEQVNGNAFTVGHLFAGFHSRNFSELIKLGLLYFVLNMVVLVLLLVFMFVQFGGAEIIALIQAGDIEKLEALIEGKNAEPVLQLLSLLISLLLTLPIIMAIWFAPALVAINDVPAIDAMLLSFKACLLNVIPFLIYGVIAIILLILASIPLFLGHIILIPMLTASVYISYKDIFSGGNQA